MKNDIAEAAEKLLIAIEAAKPDELALYYSMVGITGACFSGGVVALFQEQLRAVAGRLALPEKDWNQLEKPALAGADAVQLGRDMPDTNISASPLRDKSNG